MVPAVLVVLGMMAATATAEGTGPKVTLRTAAGPLKKGAPLVAFSSDLSFSEGFECTKNTFSGIVKSNTKEKLPGEIAVASSSGEQNREGGCAADHIAFGPANVEWQNLPWKLKFTNTGTVQVTTSLGDKRVKFVETFPAAGGAKCIYADKKVLSSFAVSATLVPLVITMTGQRFTLLPGSTASCRREGTLGGMFSTTSNGEAVEVEVK
jgi:hypothetical protein